MGIGRDQDEGGEPPDFPRHHGHGEQGNMSEVEPGHQREAPEKNLPDDQVEREVRNRQTAEQVFKLGEKGHEEERAGVAGGGPATAFCAPYFSAFAGSWSSSFCFWVLNDSVVIMTSKSRA